MRGDPPPASLTLPAGKRWLMSLPLPKSRTEKHPSMAGGGYGQNHGFSLLSGSEASLRVVGWGASASGLEKLATGEQPEVYSEEQLKALGFAINVVSK